MLDAELKAPNIAEPRYRLGSADKVLQVLLIFSSGQPVRVTDASAYLGVSRSSAHRILSVLEERKFVRQDPTTRAYLVGDALMRLSRSVAGDRALRTIAIPELNVVARRLRETAHFVVLTGNQSTFVACSESPEPVHTGNHVGTSFPAHTTASGKAMLARLPRAALRELYKHENFAGVRRNAIGSWSALIAELDSVRETGYATNLQESEAGVNAIAVDVSTEAGTTYGALVLSGPSNRLKRYKMQTFGCELRGAAERIARALAAASRPLA